MGPRLLCLNWIWSKRWSHPALGQLESGMMDPKPYIQLNIISRSQEISGASCCADAAEGGKRWWFLDDHGVKHRIFVKKNLHFGSLESTFSMESWYMRTPSQCSILVLETMQAQLFLILCPNLGGIKFGCRCSSFVAFRALQTGIANRWSM